MTHDKLKQIRKMILVPEGSMSPRPVDAATTTPTITEKSLQTPSDNFSRLGTKIYDV